jgi:hypothetical protein
MSQQINPVAVRDVVLDLDDKINYAVFRSGQNISVQRYPANSATSSSHVYAVQVPSTSTIVSRNLVWGATFTITVAGTPAAGMPLVNFTQLNATFPIEGGDTFYFGADCFAPFPLNQLCTNMSITINNTTVSSQVNQILDPLLRAVDKKNFEKWNSTTPTQLDKYGDYEQALCQSVPPEFSGTEPFSGTNPVEDAMKLRVCRFNSPFNTFEDANCNNNEVSRNSFKLNSVVGNNIGDGATRMSVSITITVREPIFVSPFLFGENVEEPGLAGLTQINISAQMDSLGKRVLRWVSDPRTVSKAITSITFDQPQCYVEALYYTPKPSDMIPATIITPLSTNTLYQLPAQAPVLVGASGRATSNSIMLNSYPDKVIVWVDNYNKWVSPPGGTDPNQLNEYSNGVSDSYATIDSVVITLNNQSGILSTFSAEQLYRASIKSGSQQTWAEFSGLQTEYYVANITTGAVGGLISTTGSVLMLNFGDVINISQDFYAPGSLSTAQFQITVNFTNNLQYTLTPQLNLLMMYSGILSTANGASSAYTSGVLTKENVLNASAVPNPINSEKLQRYVGAGLKGSMKAISSAVMPILRKDLSENLGSMALNRLSKKLKN